MSRLDFMSIHTLSTMHAKCKMVAQSKRLWEHLYLAGQVVNFDIILDYLDSYSVYIKSVTVQDVRQISHESDDFTPVLSDIINYCFNLKALYVKTCPLINMDFRVYGELCKQIHTLKMCNIETVMPSTITYKYRFHSKCFARMISQFTNLQHLEIVNTSNLTGGNVMQIVRAMPKLLDLNVEGSVVVGPRIVINIMGISPALQIVKFSHKQYIHTEEQEVSLKKWFHLTMMYYPWITFAETLTSQVQSYLSSRKK